MNFCIPSLTLEFCFGSAAAGLNQHDLAEQEPGGVCSVAKFPSPLLPGVPYEPDPHSEPGGHQSWSVGEEAKGGACELATLHGKLELSLLWLHTTFPSSPLASSRHVLATEHVFISFPLSQNIYVLLIKYIYISRIYFYSYTYKYGVFHCKST